MQTIDDMLAQCIRDLVAVVETLAREKKELEQRLHDLEAHNKIKEGPCT